MTWPTPFWTPEELAERARQRAAHDDNIAATKRTYETLEKKARPFGISDKYLPNPLRQWLRKLISPELQLKVDDARLAYQWAEYDKVNRQRPLYPRRRALSSSNPQFRRSEPGKQEIFLQEQSPLFSTLPTELRLEIYRKLFGNWIVMIAASHGGYNGPPGSQDPMVYFGSMITNWETGECLSRGAVYSHLDKGEKTLKPWVLPLLQSCRRIYEEAVYILYTESVFKTTGSANAVTWTRYLLRPRLATIRTVHICWNIGYPWDAATHEHVLDSMASLRQLRKLCILAHGDKLIDLQDQRLIDAQLWAKKKHIFIAKWKKFDFIKDVDIFLPIAREVLREAGDERVRNVRVHGVDEEEARGKPVVCACAHMPEKRVIEQR